MIRWRQLPEPVRSLQGLAVVITGRLERNGQWVTRDEAVRMARLAGARPRPQRARASYSDDLLVIGSSAHWKHGDLGAQEERVMQLQAQGSSIRIIDQDGFFALIDGGWAYPLSAEAEPVEYPSPFLPYRPTDPDIQISGYEWNTAGDALTEAVSRHRLMQEELAERLDSEALVPLTPASNGCAFDIAWQDSQGRFHVVEIKSLTGASVLRLGIGQVLDYAVRLREQGWAVVPHLWLGGPPVEPAHWRQVAWTAGVQLSWSIDELLASRDDAYP